LKETPDQLVSWYTERWKRFQAGRELAYEEIKATYNRHPNAADLLFLSRSCYGGVIRFRRDGYMSTPIGIHDPISPDSFTQRVGTWRKRVAGARFECCDFEDTIERAGPADVVYCDPPYSDTQSILYGAQAFSLERLLAAIRRAKGRGVFVALSIDGKKKSGKKICDVPIPDDLFEHSVFVASSSSMLKRFQMEGETSESELVADRLLLTW